jgi:hypothetical protein
VAVFPERVDLRNRYGETTFKYQIPSLLNGLPEELKRIDNQNEMKKKIQNHYLENNNEI